MKKIKFDLTDREKDRRPKKNDKKGYLGQKDQTFESLPYEECLCYICGKDEDHVLSWDLNKKPYRLSLVKLLSKTSSGKGIKFSFKNECVASV